MRSAMRWVVSAIALVGLGSAGAFGGVGGSGGRTAGRVIHIHPGPRVQKETQTALIRARPGDVIQFSAGRFDFTMGLSLAVEGVTVRGAGMDRTFLSFKKQEAGKEGLLVTRGRFLLQDLTVEDTKGDAIKVNDATGVTFRRVRARWTGGSKESNGAYGLYPVLCKNVLIDRCVANAASDAGIYVGQSRNIIVRGCRAEGNVAGIEIENCTDADVYNNVATDNAGGLLVFDLPGLQVKNGQRVRVHDNEVFANNHPNFAPKGNIVASVAPGTGMMVMATDHVELFKNSVRDNQTFGLIVVSFLITGRPLTDKAYDPFPEAVYVHDNTFSNCGTNPAGERAELMTALLGKPLPDIIYDGIQNPARLVDGKLPPDRRIYVRRNGEARFVNLHWSALDTADLVRSRQRVERDPSAFDGELPPLPPVTLPGGR